MVWQRARNDEQKAQRRLALLQAAERLFESTSLQDISLNGIARAANISKANVYRYFESREELFLHLTLDALREWLADLRPALVALKGTGDGRAVAEAFASTLTRNPRFGRLSSVMATVLERNVSAQGIRTFKRAYMGEIFAAIPDLAAALPRLGPEQLKELVGGAYFLWVGMWPAAHPPGPVVEAMRAPDLAMHCVDFERDFAKQFTRLVAGLRAESG